MGISEFVVVSHGGPEIFGEIPFHEHFEELFGGLFNDLETTDMHEIFVGVFVSGDTAARVLDKSPFAVGIEEGEVV